jgi:hypothetical protein
MQKIGSAACLIYVILLLSACSVRKTPKLPDLQQTTFSEEEILQKKMELEEKIRKIRESLARTQRHMPEQLLSAYTQQFS